MITSRWYQTKALDEIRKYYANGTKRVLLYLATGAGKTFCFSQILKGVHEKGKNGLLVVRGKDLVDQASQRLFREGVPHGCLQGNHWNNRPNERLQLCSIDTLYRRRIAPKADLVVIDECHFATSDSFMWLVAQYPDAYFLPVSATPHVKKGLRHIAEAVVYPVTIRQLMKEGYLAKPTYYAPSHVVLDDVSLDGTGDYNNRELGAAIEKSTVFGDIVSHYKRLVNGQPAVVFAVSIEHSKMIVARFIAAGIPAKHIEADTPSEERRAAIADLEDGTLKVISNVGILCTGVDIPFLKVVILARPTKSYNLFIQQCGRGTRVIPGIKSTFTILDHANNIEEHGFIEYERECDLDGKTINKKGPQDPKPMMCKVCYGMFEREIGMSNCPLCGAPLAASGPTKPVNEQSEGVLAEVSMDTILMKRVIQLATVGARRGSHPKWVWHCIREEFSEEDANRIKPEIAKCYANTQPVTKRNTNGN